MNKQEQHEYVEMARRIARLTVERAEALDALESVVRFFELGAWGSETNKADALNEARSVLAAAKQGEQG